MWAIRKKVIFISLNYTYINQYACNSSIVAKEVVVVNVEGGGGR